MRTNLALCGLALALSLSLAAADTYELGPDSQRQPGVPRGVVTRHQFSSSKVYPGTVRDYWIYVPAQYSPAKPACVMVVQDGGGFVKEDGSWRAPAVFDNLIAKGDMPVTIGIFVDPGVMPARDSNRAQSRYNRSYEYDALGGRYARFLADELLPEVAAKYKLSTDPNDRAIAGSSSGGIAAFNAAWNRPDVFHRVVSFIGSYTNLRGGDTLASLIRKSEPKPLRVFLQDGRADQDIYSGSWFLGNQEMYAALQYAGYESEFVIGTEGHNAKHGGAIFPDALRWIWKGYPAPVAKPARTNARGVYSILEPGKEWELVSAGPYQLTADSTVDRDGNVFFTDHARERIMKFEASSGKVTVFKQPAGGAHGIAFGPDGRLYAGQHDKKRIVAFSMADGTETVIAENAQTHHLTVTADGQIYYAEPLLHRVSRVSIKGGTPVPVIEKTVDFPRGVRVSTDQSLLVVNDPNTKWVWSFERLPDGSVTNGQPFYRLESDDESSASDAAGMAFDTEGFLYVATRAGIQICDQPGRVNTIINPPVVGRALNEVLLAGNWLYAADGERLYRRQVKRKGAESWNPVKPPQPRL